MWFRVDDSFYDHPKVMGIPSGMRAKCIGIWLLVGAYCSRQQTDGAADLDVVKQLGCTPAMKRHLVAVGLWIPTDTGILMHDWAAWNPTRASLAARRAENTKRVNEWRRRHEQGDDL